jgi:hypothetical protein
MRTTIDIPDPLMKKAKMKAVEKGITLKELFTELLEKELCSDPMNHQNAPWKQLKGKGSASSLKPTDSAFDDYQGPDWVQANQVNEPDT